MEASCLSLSLSLSVSSVSSYLYDESLEGATARQHVRGIGSLVPTPRGHAWGSPTPNIVEHSTISVLSKRPKDS